ncbi:MAG: hypothetical protein GY805_28720 [Chloroflexi bacterium]|nr:hypothetical protein [Chloroflexota bacterium]
MSESKNKRRGGQILPTNKVVTVAPTESDLNELVAALEAAGFNDEQIYIHHGEIGKAYVDPDGSRHGFLGQLIRKYQRLAGQEARMLEMAEKGLEAGHYLVGVQTNGREEQWRQVGDIMKEHTQQSIFFCSPITIHVIQF